MKSPTFCTATWQFRVFARLMVLVAWLGLPGFAAQPPRIAQAAAQPAAFASSIPAAQLLNLDGTLNLARGEAGSVDLHGWNVKLDPERGPIFSPQGPASAAWTPVSNGVSDWVLALAVSGHDVYVGGSFTLICGNSACNSGDVTVNHVAMWNGSTWSALGNGVDKFVRALAISGSDVYVGGQFTQVCGNVSCTSGTLTVNNIAKWNGSSWSALANGVESDVYALAVSGGNVYVGGTFDWICADSGCSSSSTTASHIAKWDGSSWSALGGGVSGLVVDALAASVSGLYVGGLFAQACNDPDCFSMVNVNNVARWDGSGWSALGNGVSDEVFALALSGADVYVGGKFLQLCGNLTCTANHVTVNNIAKWSSGSWSTLGNGLDGQVNALALSGGDLYVGGAFIHVCSSLACNSNTQTVNHLARWDGASWSALGNGMDGIVRALAVNGSVLYGGGYSITACGNSACNSGNVPINHIAQYSVVSSLPIKVFLPLVIR